MDQHAFLSAGNVAWWVTIRQTFTKKIPTQLNEYCSCDHLKCRNKKIIFSWMMDNEKGTPENSVSKTNWQICAICQEATSEALQCPADAKRSDVGAGYKTLAGNIEKFSKLGCMPTDLCLSRLDEGNGIEGTFLANKARWHKSCYALFNSTKVKCAEKRRATLEEDLVGGKFTRSNVSVCSKETVPACFICDKCDGQTLHNVSTLGLDDQVRECATLLNEERLLAKLSGGDLIALEAKYHTKCLSLLYRKAQYAKEGKEESEQPRHRLDGIALAELVSYIEEFGTSSAELPTFKLADLANMYKSCLQRLGCDTTSRVNTSRLKERLVFQIPGLQCYNKGRDVYLAFRDDVGFALHKAHEQDCDEEAMHLATTRAPIDISHAVSSSKSVCQLPEAYTEVAPVIAPAKHPQVSATTVNIQLDGGVFNRSFKDEVKWLENSSNVICNQERLKEEEVVSWGAFHSRDLSSSPSASAISALLPLFPDQAKSIAMIRHAMDIIKLSVNHLNPGQVQVIALDQPLFAAGKEIQWNWSDLYGEKKFVVMFGGLHIEMAFLKVIGGWLQGRGWTTALADANVATPGTAESFVKAASVTRSCRAHQVTACSLFILLQKAYTKYKEGVANKDDIMSFERWCARQVSATPQFQYWYTALQLELLLLVFLKSLWVADFHLYVDGISKMLPWFFAMNHSNYARWLPVHLRDMCSLD